MELEAAGRSQIALESHKRQFATYGMEKLGKMPQKLCYLKSKTKTYPRIKVRRFVAPFLWSVLIISIFDSECTGQDDCLLSEIDAETSSTDSEISMLLASHPVDSNHLDINHSHSRPLELGDIEQPTCGFSALPMCPIDIQDPFSNIQGYGRLEDSQQVTIEPDGEILQCETQFPVGKKTRLRLRNKVTRKQVYIIYGMKDAKGEKGNSLTLAKRFGITQKAVHDIWNQRTWKKATDRFDRRHQQVGTVSEGIFLVQCISH